MPKFTNYREEDYEAVCDFLIELNRDNKNHCNWNWARFEWMYEHPEFDKSAKEAYVISDMEFYEKLGFQKDVHFTFYWKEL